MNCLKKWNGWGFWSIVLIMLVIPHISYCTTISLMWQQVTLNVDGSQCTDLAGYKIYYGAHSGLPYDGTNIPEGASPIDIPLASLSDPANPFKNLSGIAGNLYWFVVTAYDTSNNESGYSNEVNMIAPLAPVVIIPTNLDIDGNGLIDTADLMAVFSMCKTGNYVYATEDYNNDGIFNCTDYKLYKIDFLLYMLQ